MAAILSAQSGLRFVPAGKERRLTFPSRRLAAEATI